jgi:hypothetical protein
MVGGRAVPQDMVRVWSIDCACSRKYTAGMTNRSTDVNIRQKMPTEGLKGRDLAEDLTSKVIKRPSPGGFFRVAG